MVGSSLLSTVQGGCAIAGVDLFAGRIVFAIPDRCLGIESAAGFGKVRHLY